LQNFETGEEIHYQSCLDSDWLKYFEQLMTYDSVINENDTIHKVSTSQFTRTQLKSRPDFKDWLEAEFKQLDTHDNDKMFGDPCP
jgi:hypothetical protein